MNPPAASSHPVKARFGVGCVAGAASELAYRQILLISSPGMTRRGTTPWLAERCAGRVAEVFDAVGANPDLAFLDGLVRRYRAARFDAILALGGGSVLDTAKVLGVMLGTPDRFSLREHFLGGVPLVDAPGVPVIAIPTTAGTGSEFTPFATVWDLAAGKKYSLATPRLFPVEAWLDPELTLDLPWEITLASGLDALCQALESAWSRRATPQTLELAAQSARLSFPVLRRGRRTLTLADRTDLLRASMLAGLAISHTRTALCHSISYPLTARFGLAHGLACSFTMPAVLRFNSSSDDGRLVALAAQLGFASTAQLAAGLEELLQACEVDAHLAAGAITLARIAGLDSEMITPGRSDNNLRLVSGDDIRGILADAAGYLPALRRN
jgi:alcohol dehydrogenase